MPPSIAHRFESYFVRMKFSILLLAVSCDKTRRSWLIDVRFCWDMTRRQLGFPIPAIISRVHFRVVVV